MSKAIIEAMKKRMSLEERKEFVKHKNFWHGHDDHWQYFDGKTLRSLIDPMQYWPFGDWLYIYKRFTPEELSLTINIKEL